MSSKLISEVAVVSFVLALSLLIYSLVSALLIDQDHCLVILLQTPDRDEPTRSIRDIDAIDSSTTLNFGFSPSPSCSYTLFSWMLCKLCRFSFGYPHWIYHRQAFSNILSARWAFKGEVSEGAYCTMQAALKQIGNDGVGTW